MKTKFYLLIGISIFVLSGCSKSPEKIAQSSVEKYLKENLKNPKSYESIYFSKIDTLPYADTSETNKISFYVISHSYEILNSEKEKVKMSVTFSLDKDLNVNEPSTKSINGDYGSMSGNVYWKYNNYVGNKPDAGSKVILYSLDTIRNNLKYETTVDIQGYYKFEKVFPGHYFLFVRSENVTDCPESHLINFRIYDKEIFQLFNFDINTYKSELAEIKVLDSLYHKTSFEFPINGSLSQMRANVEETKKISKERDVLIVKLFELFPDSFKSKIKFYGSYSNAYDFSIIEIEENSNLNEITDFGITCI